MIEYIQHYRSQGLTPIPLHNLVAGVCTCTAAGKCTSGGKHPRVNRQSAIEATQQQWESWIRAWPSMNIGILTGRDTGIFVVDIDPRHQGDKSLSRLIELHGHLPQTVTASTGGGGIHYLFRIPEGLDIRNSAGDESGTQGVAPGIDIRGNGGLIVVEPSTTKGTYKWN